LPSTTESPAPTEEPDVYEYIDQVIHRKIRVKKNKDGTITVIGQPIVIKVVHNYRVSDDFWDTLQIPKRLSFQQETMINGDEEKADSTTEAVAGSEISGRDALNLTSSTESPTSQAVDLCNSTPSENRNKHIERSGKFFFSFSKRKFTSDLLS